MANSILAKLAVQISANTAQFNKSLKDASSSLSRFQSSVSDSIKGLVAGFGAMQIAQFTLDVSKLAGEAEGVKRAFDKLPNSVRVMNELKAVTAGTVSELELMKRAVTATNFGIQLEQLPKLLEFATVRAQQTGQSVDYLVDSIVTGIGRKSPLILDNLGISTTRLKEKFNGAALEAQSIGDVAAAVGQIAEEELGKMGKMSENAATRMARLNAEWQNLKVVIGNAINSGDVNQAFSIAKMTEDLTAFFKVLQNNQIANQLQQQKGGLFAYLAPNVEQLFNIREYASEIERVLKNAEEFKKIGEEGFVKIPTLGLRIQESIAKITADNQAKEKARLESLKKINEERAKEYKKLTEFSELFRRTQEDQQLVQRLNPTFSPMFQNSDAGGFDINEFLPDPEEIDYSVNKLTEGLMAVRGELDKTATKWVSLSFAAGGALAAMVSGEENLGKTIAGVTADIIASSSQRIAAFLGEGIAKAFSINPLAGAAIAAAGLGVITGLLRKVGAGSFSGAGGNASARPQFSRASVGMVQSSVVVTGVIRGQDIYLSNQNYQKASGYTKG